MTPFLAQIAAPLLGTAPAPIQNFSVFFENQVHFEKKTGSQGDPKIGTALMTNERFQKRGHGVYPNLGSKKMSPVPIFLDPFLGPGAPRAGNTGPKLAWRHRPQTRLESAFWFEGQLAKRSQTHVKAERWLARLCFLAGSAPPPQRFDNDIRRPPELRQEVLRLV